MTDSKRSLRATKTRNTTTTKQQSEIDEHTSSPTQKAATDQTETHTEKTAPTKSHGETTELQKSDDTDKDTAKQEYSSPPPSSPSFPKPTDNRTFQQLVHDYGSDSKYLTA